MPQLSHHKQSTKPTYGCRPLLFLFLLSSMLVTGCSPDPDVKKLSGVWDLESGDRLARRLGQAATDSTLDRQKGSAIDSANDFASGLANGSADDPSFDSEMKTDHFEIESFDHQPEESAMRIEFRRNGRLQTLTRMGKITPNPKQGTWKLISGDIASDGKITIECNLLGQTTEHEIRFIDEDTIEMVPPNMAGTHQKLRFLRTRQ